MEETITRFSHNGNGYCIVFGKGDRYGMIEGVLISQQEKICEVKFTTTDTLAHCIEKSLIKING